MKATAKTNKKTISKSKPTSALRSTSASSVRGIKSSGRTKKASSNMVSAKSASSTKKNSNKKESSHEDQLKDLFYGLLKDTLNAEKQMVRALPKLAKAATSKELANAFKKHLGETEKQVSRLEKVFSICGFKVASKKCEAMEGLVKEGQEAIEETAKGSLVRDVALIVAAQKVEHYEIAAYGSLRSIASILGYGKAIELLQKTLEEEGSADKKLTELSESINPKASNKTEKSSREKGAREESDEKVQDAVYLDDEEEEEELEKSTSGFGSSL